MAKKKKSKVTRKEVKENVALYHKVHKKYKEIEAQRNFLSNYLKNNLPADREQKFGDFTAKASVSMRDNLETSKVKSKYPKVYQDCNSPIQVVTLSVKPA